jgi:hypothetical protein
MSTFQIERLNRRTGEWTPTIHTREGKTANEAVCKFVVSRKRGRNGTAVTKSGKTYRAVAA